MFGCNDEDCRVPDTFEKVSSKHTTSSIKSILNTFPARKYSKIELWQNFEENPKVDSELEAF